MNSRTRYPAGVSCFIDTERADVGAAMAFYGGLFGWSFDEVSPPGADAQDRYLMAKLDGLIVAGLGVATNGSPPAWNTYVSVDSADAALQRARAAGGSVLLEALTVGPAGRTGSFADPEGAVIRVWQADHTVGSELVNAPGTWNWSDLETRDIPAAQVFYTDVFGWEYQEVDFGEGSSALIRVPGYGDHLEALNPGTLAAHKSLGAPDGFSDAIGWMQPPATADGDARWAVTFSVADADETARHAPELGGTVLAEPFDVPYVRIAALRDPDGATFAIGEFKPPA